MLRPRSILYRLVLVSKLVDAGVAAFEAKYYPSLFQRLQRMKLSDADQAEVIGQLRVKLLAESDGGLLVLVGRGQLESFVRVCGYRISVSMRKKSASLVSDECLDVPAASEMPGIARHAGQV